MYVILISDSLSVIDLIVNAPFTPTIESLTVFASGWLNQ